MTGLTFMGGNFGIYGKLISVTPRRRLQLIPDQGGNQQFTVRNAIFSGCKTGIGLIWDCELSSSLPHTIDLLMN